MHENRDGTGQTQYRGWSIGFTNHPKHAKSNVGFEQWIYRVSIPTCADCTDLRRSCCTLDSVLWEGIWSKVSGAFVLPLRLSPWLYSHARVS